MDVLFFWEPTPTLVNPPGKGCLSQWWPATTVIDSKKYFSAEHYMMAEKARLFDDTYIEQRIIDSNDPNEAMWLGRQITGFSKNTWEEHRYSIILNGNLEKFTQHYDLKSYLLSTNDQHLAFACPGERVWGIGFTEDDPRAADRKTWKGLNLLGKALMEVRQKLGADLTS